MTYRPLFAVACLAVFALAGAKSEVPDASVVEKIKREGLQNSQIPDTLSYLTDVIGPRLTASPNMKRANEWTRDTLTKWGLTNAHLEPWGPFGRGWQLDRFSAQVTSPQCIPLIAFPKAWSPSVNVHGAEVVLVDVQSEDQLAALKGKLKGKVVLNGGVRPLDAIFTAQGSRITDEDLAKMGSGQPSAPRTPGQPNRNRQQGVPSAALTAAKWRFFMAEGVAAVLDAARGSDGTIFVQSATVPTPASTPAAQPGGNRRPASPWAVDAPATLPQVSVSAEHYNRVVRILKAGVPVKLDMEVKCQFVKGDGMGYNTVAELAGTDKKDEVVMVGGHMDSWHAGTGATDNAAGVAVAMEAVRILKAAGLQPRRTVRVALWSGEEQGLFGSRAYVAEHFGTRQTPAGGTAPVLTTKPEHAKISAYFNLDNGTGKIRGVYQQSNEKVGPIFADWLAPFKDMGATTLTIRNTGSTDHVSFDGVGIPGFQFIQDPIEYDTRTHHSNQDVYDRIQLDDLKQAAVIMATFLYQAANRDELLPRKG